jgi:prophage antirepressor-like protein
MANQHIEIEDETKLYSFNNIQLSIIGTFEEPWFVGEEIVSLLGYSNVKKALLMHVTENEKTTAKVLRENIQKKSGPTLGSLTILKKLNWQKVLISEFGLYELIFNSQMPIAKDFKEWVKTILRELRLNGKYKIEKELKEIKSEINSKNCVIESKSEEIVELNNRRFLDKKKIHIKLSDRIISLGYLTSIQKNYLFRKRKVQVHGRQCTIVHPDIHKVEGKILHLSNILSNAYKVKYKKNPDIEKSNRSNLYTYSFYEEFGDKIIGDFFERDALKNWDIEWTWKATPDEQCPEFNVMTHE